MLLATESAIKLCRYLVPAEPFLVLVEVDYGVDGTMMHDPPARARCEWAAAIVIVTAN